MFFSVDGNLQKCLLPWGLDPQLADGSLGPESIHTAIDISIVSAVFAGHTVVTNRQTHTDRQRERETSNAILSVAVGRIYAMNTMRP